MVSVNKIESLLPAYKADYKVISDHQSVNDIIDGIKQYHLKSADQYDKIAPYFLDTLPEKTCFNVYSFIRKNIRYSPESLQAQKVKTPSAIIAERNDGTDCKNFSLFACGILDAINRSGLQKIPYCYRFVSYDIFDSSPTHVFCVAFPGSDSEIFIDGVLPEFDQRTNYVYKLDKKFKAMLYGVSGYNEINQDASQSDLNPGVNLIDTGNVTENTIGDIVQSGLNTFAPGAGEILGSTGVLAVFSKAGVSPSFFDSFSFLSFLDNSVDHWKSRAAKFKSWTANQILAYYVSLINRSNPNFEDIQQFAQLYLNLHNNDQGKFQYDIVPQLDYGAAQVYNALVDKALFPNGQSTWTGHGNETYYKSELEIPLSRTKGYNPLTNIFSTNTTTQGAASTAGISTLLIFGLLAAAVYMFTRKN